MNSRLPHSITSFARASTAAGRSRPSAFGLAIDDEFVLRGRLHRQVGRLLALEDTADIAGVAPERRNEIGAVSAVV
jgi:hypothetical protein